MSGPGPRDRARLSVHAMSYADIEQFKRYLSLGEHSGWREDDDEVLQDALDDAAGHIDSECLRSFEVAATPSTRRYLVRSGYVFVDDIASAGSISVATVDGDAVEFGVVTPSHGRPVGMLTVPTGLREVDVTAGFGWAETPRSVVRANMILAHRLYKRADTPSGVGGFDATGAAVRMPWRDPDVVKLLGPYRKVVVG